MPPPDDSITDGQSNERTPLLRDQNDGDDAPPKAIDVSFGKDDPDDPRQWAYSRKMLNVAIIALMAVLSPLASSMFTPAIAEIAETFNTSTTAVVGVTTGYTVTLGFGPLVLAPLSETVGRRRMYMICFGVFSILQIPTALSPDLTTMIVCRVFAGFFGSVGVANGGGSLGDMFAPHERAGVFGWYLLGPLMGPTLGPLFGGIITQTLNWRWMFWILTIVCTTNTILGFLFLKETYAPVILNKRCEQRGQEDGGSYTFPGRDARPLLTKILQNVKRPITILFTQPIVFTMAAWQAVVFAATYSLFTNMEEMYGPKSPYGLTTLQVGLLYLGPGLGQLLAVLFLVPRIDTVFNKLTAKHGGKQKPEYRLPLANIGSVLLPLTLFVFAWTVQRTHWFVSIACTAFFGLGQVAIFNTAQNYYIDAFSKYAASAIAAGTVFRSIVGGTVPLLAPRIFKSLGYGWGWTVFGIVTLLLSPSPVIFYKYGERLRERFHLDF